MNYNVHEKHAQRPVGDKMNDKHLWDNWKTAYYDINNQRLQKKNAENQSLTRMYFSFNTPVTLRNSMVQNNRQTNCVSYRSLSFVWQYLRLAVVRLELELTGRFGPCTSSWITPTVNVLTRWDWLWLTRYGHNVSFNSSLP